MSYVLGVSSFKGKSLALVAGEVEAMVTPSMLGLGDDFYGGSVKQMAKVEPGVYYCIDKNTQLPKDVYISDLRELEVRFIARGSQNQEDKSILTLLKRWICWSLWGSRRKNPWLRLLPKVEEEDPLDLDSYDPKGRL